MRIRMGFRNQVDGYLEDRPGNTIAVVDAPDPAARENLEGMVQALFNPQAQPAAAFLASLPTRYTGQTWAQDVALDGVLGDIDRQ